MATLHHSSLNTTLHGISTPDDSVWQFRGLPYASISSRFAVATPHTPPAGNEMRVLDCTSFGPRCPQNAVDYRHLLRIPEDQRIKEVEVQEDEFACLNLDVTTPARRTGDRAGGKGWPVMVWIHGGSQTVTFGSAAQGLCDSTNLVRTSVEKKQPMIVVTLNYRLNIFAFGNGSGAKNLALSDQRAALDFVKKHIGEFGGDAENITLAGESAGAVYVHAHIATGAQIRQAILQSGSLYLSPPLPESMAAGVVDRVQAVLSRNGELCDLETASVEDVLAAQKELGMVSLFLQMDLGLEGWKGKFGEVERLLIGDCEYESNFFHTGISTLPAPSISATFSLLGSSAPHIKALYGIIPTRPTSCKTGALDFLHDVRFTLATERIAQQYRNAGKSVFRYLVDQANPWQPSSRAHHAVDLPLLFGTFDLSFNPGAARVSRMMVQKWIEFVNGGEPWEAGGCFAFGPLGECGGVDDEGIEARRRMGHCRALGRCDGEKVDAVWKALAVGNISLEN